MDNHQSELQKEIRNIINISTQNAKDAYENRNENIISFNFDYIKASEDALEKAGFEKFESNVFNDMVVFMINHVEIGPIKPELKSVLYNELFKSDFLLYIAKLHHHVYYKLKDKGYEHEHILELLTTFHAKK